MTQELKIRRIECAIEHIDRVLCDIKDATQEDMNKETLLGRAICYSILQIGEELSRLRDKFEEEYPNIPWKKVNGLRNLLVHEYAKVDFEQIKYVVNNDLIPLRKQLENLLISLKQ